MLIKVKDNNVMRAYKILKKKMHSEGIVKELMDRKFYQKPSLIKRLKRKDAINRQKKLTIQNSKSD